MKNLFSGLSKTLSAGILYSSFVFNTCSADLSFEFENVIQFSKNDVTILHLDNNNFRGTATTTDWLSNKKNVSYLLNGLAIWIDPSNFYFEVEATYGWLLYGKTIGYPLTWDVQGHQAGFDLETGYIYNVCDRFKFIPQFGFSYTESRSTLRHQHLAHASPIFFVSKNGNKTRTVIYYPYIGFEVSFTGEYCCYKYQLSTYYDLGFGAGHSKLRVPRFFVTDIPTTSSYGSHIKLRDMISQQFGLIFSHSFADKWQYALELEYNMIYNTSKLPVKLQGNKEIVAAGQFTPTQYHRCNEYISQSWSIVFNLVYNFGESGGAFIK